MRTHEVIRVCYISIIKKISLSLSLYISKSYNSTEEINFTYEITKEITLLYFHSYREYIDLVLCNTIYFIEKTKLFI